MLEISKLGHAHQVQECRTDIADDGELDVEIPQLLAPMALGQGYATYEPKLCDLEGQSRMSCYKHLMPEAVFSLHTGVTDQLYQQHY